MPNSRPCTQGDEETPDKGFNRPRPPLIKMVDALEAKVEKLLNAKP